jgi:hypothetical protein
MAIPVAPNDKSLAMKNKTSTSFLSYARATQTAFRQRGTRA